MYGISALQDTFLLCKNEQRGGQNAEMPIELCSMLLNQIYRTTSRELLFQIRRKIPDRKVVFALEKEFRSYNVKMVETPTTIEVWEYIDVAVFYYVILVSISLFED